MLILLWLDATMYSDNSNSTKPQLVLTSSQMSQDELLKTGAVLKDDNTCMNRTPIALDETDRMYLLRLEWSRLRAK